MKLEAGKDVERGKRQGTCLSMLLENEEVVKHHVPSGAFSSQVSPLELNRYMSYKLHLLLVSLWGWQMHDINGIVESKGLLLT